MLLALGHLVAYHQINVFSRLGRDADQCQAFLAKLEHFRVSLAEAQSAQKGYLLTGSATYTRMYRTALSGVDKYSKELWVAGAGSQSRRQALNQAISLTRQLVTLLEESVNVRRGRGLSAAAGLAGTGRGMAVMDQINGLVDSMEERERLALDSYISRSDDNLRRASFFGMAGDAIALVLIVIVVMVLRRQLEVSARLQAVAGRAAKEWESTFDAVSDMVSIQNRELTLIRVNKAFARAFKTSPQSLIGKKCWEMAHGTSGPIENCPHLKVLETGKPASYEFYEPKVGLYLEVSASPIFDERGKVTSTVHIARNITERKRIEDSLGQLRRRMEVILESAGEGITGMDVNGKITFANPAASRMLGWQGDELVGQDAAAVLCGSSVPPEGQSASADSFVGICRSGQTHHQDNAEFIRKDGARFPVEYTCSPKKDGGQVVGAVVVFRDISERKAVERLKDEFISMVSHELRTPLTTIRESVSQVVDGILGPTTAQQQEFLAICLNDADRLKRIIDDLLDMSKIEAGKLSLVFSYFDAIGLVKEIAATFQPLVTNKGLELRTVFPSQTIQIHADRDRLLQVLTNLVGNAVKFTDHGSITIGVKESDGQLEYWVEDTGQGIAEKDLLKLFEKFRQFDASVNSPQKGTGLGMAISKGIVELHKGQIKVASHPSQGTKVTFFIPIT